MFMGLLRKCDRAFYLPLNLLLYSNFDQKIMFIKWYTTQYTNKLRK